MNRTFHTAALLPLLLWGCSILDRDETPTIASLGRQPVQLEDMAIESNESRAMQAYHDFLQTGDDSTARPEAMRRLADLNLEAEELPQAGHDSGGHDAGSRIYPEQGADSIKLYQDILALYPDQPDNDRVLYQLARAYELGNQPDQSLATLMLLIGRYPQSRYLQEAQFRRGEILFVKQDYRAAEQAYQAVVAAGDSGAFYEQSLYKLGWSFFKQGLFDEGLDAFMALLDRQLNETPAGDERLAHLSRAGREVVEDTLRVVSLSFSYESGPESVSGYFSRHGARPYEDVIYDSLGQLYLHKERYTDAAQTYRTFVEHNPDHRQAPRFQMRVIETYRTGNFPTLVLEGKKEFVDRYNLQSAYWQHHQAADAGQVVRYLKSTMIDLARHYHALAQRTRKPVDYQQATHWYRTYLASFAGSDEAPNMNFLLAELLFESDQYRIATQEYERTAYDYGAHAQAADAGYAAVLAYARAESRLKGEEQQAWHRQSIEGALRFAGTFPTHPQAMAVLTRSSEQLLALNEPGRAIQVAQQVTTATNATPEQRRVAWTVQAHARFDQADYLQAEQAYQQVLALTPKSPDEQAQIIERLASSIYKQGEAARARGETGLAVDHFLRIRDITPGASIVATAEYDAAAGLMSLQDWRRATTVLERFRTSHPGHPQQAEVTRRLATAYLAEEQPLQAAVEFERIGRSEGDPELRREAVWQAAELYAQAGQSRQALATYKYYVSEFPRPAEAAIEGRHRIAEQYRGSGDTEQYRHLLTGIIQADWDAGAGRTDRTRYLAAKASFTLAELVYERYRAVPLVLPLKQSLAAKQRLMKQALEHYAQAADYQVTEVTTAATFRTAGIYYHLSQALLDSARPANLSGEALAEYDILLEDQAYPFEEKAIAIHETNIGRIGAGVYDPWVEKSLQQLAELVPARYARSERSVSYVEAIH